MMRLSKIVLAVLIVVNLSVAASGMEDVRVAPDGRGFVLAESGAAFVPYGNNFSVVGPLLDDDWNTTWPEVEAGFRDMKDLGANVARAHLQFGKFMSAAGTPNTAALEWLGHLLGTAEKAGMYLDITGLGCYRPADVPPWYDSLDEAARWKTQARFWEAVASRCAASPAVFCYDLMNEPVSPGGKRKPRAWYSGELLGGFDFVQYISLDQAGRPRDEIARAWIRQLVSAIRRHDQRHLITVGLLPSMPVHCHMSGFTPSTIAPELDFISVHIYPERGKVDEAITVLKDFVTSKPLVIEETFPMSCEADELEQFMIRSRGIAAGWMGHYWGKTIADLERMRATGKLTIPDALMLDWLRLFKRFKASHM
ncbi:MAG: cellulase family glycosylhydrolase [Candidatus Sumerlaeota bacterium]|nr:cellulase family glycosylhydrolase [Candidatus Sumerlaeota bacterium]